MSASRQPFRSCKTWRASGGSTVWPIGLVSWGGVDVEVIDDDLGRSGAGARRSGFEKLLAAICEGRVGAVLSLEASRLARNGRDWHTLLEFCGLVGTLIVDEDGVYDPASPNDRLLLGMKGTMSEMELSVFRQRSFEAMKQKARRGELFLTVAIGYVKTGCRQEKIRLPALGEGGTADRISWRLPVYPRVHHMLTNPVYAGAYAFGRRTARVTIENGRKRRMVHPDCARDGAVGALRVQPHQFFDRLAPFNRDAIPFRST